MKDVIQAVLTDPSARSSESIVTVAAAAVNEYSPWD